MLFSVEEFSSATKTILAIAGGGMLLHLSNFFLQWQKNAAADRQASSLLEHDAKVTDADRLEARLQAVEQEVIECREKHINCEREHGYVKGQLDQINRTLELLHASRLIGPGQAVIDLSTSEDSSIELALEDPPKKSSSSDIMVE
jgi:hypothetical protein